MTTQTKIRFAQFTLGVTYACLIIVAACIGALVHYDEWSYIGLGLVSAGVHFINIGLINGNLNYYRAQLEQEKKNETKQASR